MTFTFATRHHVSVGCLLAGLALAHAPLVAQAPPKVETFTATTVNLTPGAGEKLKIDLFRWATDEDRENVLAVLKEKGAGELTALLEKAQTCGYVWGSGSLGYSVRYAHRVALPDGGERIILVTDRRLGSWGREPWKAAGQAAGSDEPYTVIELRLNRQGRGEGKMSFAAKIVADAEAKTVALENYAAAPVMLKDVRRGPSTGGGPS
jgi:hypothetical protein